MDKVLASGWRQPLTSIKIHHQTIYRYRTPVEFGLHKMVLRPRESRSLRLISHDLELTPAADVTWANDVFGNAVATATFRESSNRLVINSVAELNLDVEQWPVFNIAGSASNYPFLMTEDEMLDLGALRLQSYLDSDGKLASWAGEFVRGDQTNTLALLKDMSAGVASRVHYEIRETGDAQSPTQTLARNQGSCRDFGVPALWKRAVP